MSCNASQQKKMNDEGGQIINSLYYKLFDVLFHPFTGWRNTQLVAYQWLTYNETMLRAKNFGSGLLTLGLQPGGNTRLGILAR